MNNYEQLIKALRYCAESGDFKCGKDCPMHTEYPNCLSNMDKDAAAAIEALQAEAGQWKAAVKGQEDGIKVLHAEVKRLKDVIDELREAQTYIDHYGDKWMTSAKDVPTSAYNHGYMDGKNEAEQAQLPKLGEWQKAKPNGVGTYSAGYAECSHCHKVIWLGWGMNFCPNCGTQNRIIDPDDYDGAKMNDSNASNALNALDNAQDGPIITPCLAVPTMTVTVGASRKVDVRGRRWGCRNEQ